MASILGFEYTIIQYLKSFHFSILLLQGLILVSIIKPGSRFKFSYEYATNVFNANKINSIFDLFR